MVQLRTRLPIMKRRISRLDKRRPPTVVGTGATAHSLAGSWEKKTCMTNWNAWISIDPKTKRITVSSPPPRWLKLKFDAAIRDTYVLLPACVGTRTF